MAETVADVLDATAIQILKQLNKIGKNQKMNRVDLAEKSGVNTAYERDSYPFYFKLDNMENLGIVKSKNGEYRITKRGQETLYFFENLGDRLENTCG